MAPLALASASAIGGDVELSIDASTTVSVHAVVLGAHSPLWHNMCVEAAALPARPMRLRLTSRCECSVVALPLAALVDASELLGVLRVLLYAGTLAGAGLDMLVSLVMLCRAYTATALTRVTESALEQASLARTADVLDMVRRLHDEVDDDDGGGLRYSVMTNAH